MSCQITLRYSHSHMEKKKKKTVAIIVDSCFAKNEKNKSFHHGLANTSLFGSDQ